MWSPILLEWSDIHLRKFTMWVCTAVFFAFSHQAVNWYRSHSDQKLATSHNTDLVYENTRDPMLDVKWHQQAGSPTDPARAFEQYTLAAGQGDVSAQYNLGFMYENGQGVPLDQKKAIKWYKLAAAQRNKQAQRNLSLMYAKGQGVTQDYIRALMWLNLAGTMGSAPHSYIAGKMMATQQIEKAQEMAKVCQARNLQEC